MVTEMKWISVKDGYPSNGQKVKIKIYDRVTDKDLVLDAVFKDTEDYRSWTVNPAPGTSPIAKPTHWMPLPDKPKKEDI